MRVLELGSYIIPAYAGMILAEQGHEVHKVTFGLDPVQTLRHGSELWDWLNENKNRHEERLSFDSLSRLISDHDIEVVIDNIRPRTWKRWEIDPATMSDDIAWVSMRSDTPELLDGVSFDVIAQARSWMEYTNWVPFYVGDTTGGLWLAFKALSVYANGETGHHILYQASLMQKLVEGELIVDGPFAEGSTRWDADNYGADHTGASVTYKGSHYHEPVRDKDWKLQHLHHNNGRIIV